MTKPSVCERVNTVIVAYLFLDEDGAVKFTTETKVKLLCPDVYDTLFLAQEIQREFGIEIRNGVPWRWKTVGDIIKYVEKRLSSSDRP